MNRILPEMLHCLQTSTGNGTDITVLERQQARQKWQQQQHQNQQSPQELEQQSYFNDTHFNNFLQLPSITSNFNFSFLTNNNNNCDDSMMIRESTDCTIKTDPNFGNGWQEFGKYQVPRIDFGVENSTGTGCGINSVEMENSSISRTFSCPPVVGNVIPEVGNVAVMVTEEISREMGSSEKMVSKVGKEKLKKRKADKEQNPKVDLAEDQIREKKIKLDTEEVESKITHEQKNTKIRETSGESSKENSKISEVQKQDYIHVRARRGQATDSHSLAERVRREKISERMKYLQDLVPGCNKITGKAGMLDEIINYVQSLQKQVEFLSMKLATVNPRLDFNIDNFFTKDMLLACNGISPPVGISQEMANCPAYLPFNPLQEMVSSCGLDMAALRRTLSAPVTAPPATILDTSCFAQEQPSLPWETDLQNLYSMEDFHLQGRNPTGFPHQSFTGSLDVINNLKMEM